jgi:O-glycosyl hydrolase
MIHTSMTGSAYPNGLRDDPPTKLAWARYISKFIRAYGRKGVPIWSVTPQNEVCITIIDTIIHNYTQYIHNNTQLYTITDTIVSQ